MDFGRIFVIAVVVAVTAAQLAGNRSRANKDKDKDVSNKEDLDNVSDKDSIL